MGKAQKVVAVRIGSATVSCGTFADLAGQIEELAKDTSQAKLIVTPNTHHLAVLERDENFRDAYALARLQTADGWPLAALASLVARRRVDRTTGADLVLEMSRRAAERAMRIAIIGGPPGAAQRAAQALARRFPGLQVVMVDEASQSQLESAEAVQKIKSRLSLVRPNIVLLGLGAPKQEVFAARNLLDTRVGVILCIGAGISFAAGDIARAPTVITSTGLEWLHRATLEPRRLFPRYLEAAKIMLSILANGRFRAVAASENPRGEI